MEPKVIKLLEDVKLKLSEVESERPFELIFYGSRARGDHKELSDFNFYLLASSSDQMVPQFVQSIGKALDSMESNHSVSLIAGDKESFKVRVKIFEPTAIHLCESGIVVYGNDEFTSIQKKWKSESIRIPNVPTLIRYLENRYEFYRGLTTKSSKEDVSRIEKILQLNLQLWVLYNIPDITVTEIWFMDIPSRLVAMLKRLYVDIVPEEIKILVTIYEEIHELKQNIRWFLPQADIQLTKIKESISQLQDLSKILEKKV